MRPINKRNNDLAAVVSKGSQNARRFSQEMLFAQRKSVEAMRGKKPSLLDFQNRKKWNRNEKNADEIEVRLDQRINETREMLTMKTLDLEGAIGSLGVYTHMHDAITLARAEFVTKLVQAQRYVNQSLIDAESQLLAELPNYMDMLSAQLEADVLSEDEVELMYRQFKKNQMERLAEIRRKIEKSFDDLSREALDSKGTNGVYF